MTTMGHLPDNDVSVRPVAAILLGSPFTHIRHVGEDVLNMENKMRTEAASCNEPRDIKIDLSKGT